MRLERTFLEFFAGGGMAHAGFGAGWRCLFANDFDVEKGRSYAANWGADRLVVGDVHALASADVPGRAALAWASFPCQDVSLAGLGRGIGAADERTRSGAFWGFASVLEGLRREGRRPPVVVLENVMGLVTRKGGRDLATVADALVGLGYEAGALVVDSSHFVPQSRPRVFVVACAPGLGPASLRAEGPRRPWHPPSIVKAVKGLSQRAAQGWVWWDPGAPPARTASLADLLEPDAAVAWYDDAETRRLVGMMAPLHRTKVDEAAAAGFDSVGGLFVRTRVEAGGKAQRAEVRFDGVAGCLRTAQGGSSRQRLLVAGKGRVRARLLSPREGARLMGLPDSYVLPEGYTNAFHLLGDGVCAAVVAFLRDAIVEPVLESAEHGALVA